jgi:eukaryotic-like serine/threonine-protein kinase
MHSDRYFEELAERASSLESAARRASSSLVDGLAGLRIGRYSLEREIGRGGTSVVYLARRVDGGFERSVAVKILFRQTDSVAMLRRFEREQQVLSDLNHPNIASLYDGGISDNGYSYFVMEYVDGRPIDQFCDAHRLTVEERLKLFLSVTTAVDYAHKHLVIHRDLKPSNILVATDGTVKLLDFGVAKILTGHQSAVQSGLTQTGERWLTPDYAAPEQVRGESTTIATDAYQLGVVLYELLTGHGPYSRDPVESAYLAEKAVCEAEPRPPSTVVGESEGRRGGGRSGPVTPKSAAEARGQDVKQLRKKLQGDLDAIVLRALQKDVASRYGSAEALARDVERFQAGLPVDAREGKFRYRTAKFLRRHAAPLAAASAAVTLLAGMTTFYMVEVAQERDRARVEAAKANEVTDFVLGLFEAGHPDQARGEVLTARMLLERGVERAEELGDQPAVQTDMLGTIARAFHRLGETERAEELFVRELDVRRKHLSSDHAGIAHAISHLGWSHLVRHDWQGAADHFREALEIKRRVLGHNHPEVANSLNGLGLALNGDGRNAEGIRLLREALEIRRAALGGTHSDIANGLNDLAILLRTSGDSTGAEKLARESLAMRRDLFGSDHLDIAQSLSFVASYLHAKGEYATAEPLYLEALAIQRRALGVEHGATRYTAGRLVALYEGWGRPEQAAVLRAFPLRADKMSAATP